MYASECLRRDLVEFWTLGYLKLLAIRLKFKINVDFYSKILSNQNFMRWTGALCTSINNKLLIFSQLFFKKEARIYI